MLFSSLEKEGKWKELESDKALYFGPRNWAAQSRAEN
jgi:hypothetical protein